MKGIKKVKILWEDEEGNKYEQTFEVGQTQEYGEYLHTLWEIKKIEVA